MRSIHFVVPALVVLCISACDHNKEPVLGSSAGPEVREPVPLGEFAPGSDLLGGDTDEEGGEERPYDERYEHDVEAGYPICEEEFCTCYERAGDPDPDDPFICSPGAGAGGDICGWHEGDMMAARRSFSLSICAGLSSTSGWGCSYRDGMPGCEKFKRNSCTVVGGRFEKGNGRYTECAQGIYLQCGTVNRDWKGLVAVQGCWESSDFHKVTVLNGNPPSYEITPWPNGDTVSFVEVVGSIDSTTTKLAGPLCQQSSQLRSRRSGDGIESQDVELTDDPCVSEADLEDYCEQIQVVELDGYCDQVVAAIRDEYRNYCNGQCVDEVADCVADRNCNTAEVQRCGERFWACCDGLSGDGR